MKVTIWVPDDLVQGIKDAAWGSRKSVSGYLVDLHKSEVIKNNAEISLIQGMAPVKKIEPKKVTKTIEDVPKWAGGYSKEQQVRKK